MRKERRSGERLFCWPGKRRGDRGPSTPQSDRFADRSAPLRMTEDEGAGVAEQSALLSMTEDEGAGGAAQSALLRMTEDEGAGVAEQSAWLRMTILRLAVLVAVMMAAIGALAVGPALTTISDTVYRADSTPAAGTVLISWPAFQTAEGDAVAAGNQSVAIGTGGSFTTQLVPNVGASPAGTYYTVVYQLNDYTVRTEYWSVPTTATTTITAVRTAPGVGVANPAATQQYVNSAVANRALDGQVVHLAGAETISGTKQFAASPTLPPPVGNNDAATKGYVDGAVSNVGAGSYVAKSGDTMSGPLLLPGEPGRMTLAENRIIALERNDIRRNVLDRIVAAAIAFAVSAVIALHDHLGLK
jgi:hypothetical protein